MNGISFVAWTLKIAGLLYILLTIPYLITYFRLEWPRDANHFLVVLQQPSNTVSAIVHGLGAIALGVILERLWSRQGDVVR